MPKTLPITVVEPGTMWPSGDYRPIAELDVDRDLVAQWFELPLLQGTDAGLGPWVGSGGKLPSGTCIEVIGYELGGGLELRVDASAEIRRSLSEFLAVTGLPRTAIRWQHPAA